MASPLASFIDNFDLEKRILFPFDTHGGGGVGKYEQDIAKIGSNSTVTREFGTYNSGGSDTTAKIGAWLSAMGFHSRGVRLFAS